MNRVIAFLCMGVLFVGCWSFNGNTKQGIRTAVDTEGVSIADSTALGDIDMARTTVGDFKGIMAPNYSSVSNAAMSASSEVADINEYIDELMSYEEATNVIWNVSLMTHKYIYDNATQTTYRFYANNDFLVMQAVTNVPPTAEVIMKLEGVR